MSEDTDSNKREESVIEMSALANLPLRKRRELARIVSIIRAEFAAKLKHATARERREGRLLKILLFGSTARGDWVEDPKGGYFSDYDILVVVNEEVLTDMEFLLPVVERIADDEAVATDASVIIHTLKQVNAALRDGDYFFADIYNDHIPLWELVETKNQGHLKHRLQKPGKAEPKRAYEIAQTEYENYRSMAQRFLAHARSDNEAGELKSAAFQIHQSAEHAYTMFMLVRTAYRVKTHKLIKLSAFAEEYDRRFIDIWPRVKPFKGYFRKLDDAYIMARYKQRTYHVTKEQIAWMIERVEALFALADAACREHLDVLKAEAEKAGG